MCKSTIMLQCPAVPAINLCTAAETQLRLQAAFCYISSTEAWIPAPVKPEETLIEPYAEMTLRCKYSLSSSESDSEFLMGRMP